MSRRCFMMRCYRLFCSSIYKAFVLLLLGIFVSWHYFGPRVTSSDFPFSTWLLGGDARPPNKEEGDRYLLSFSGATSQVPRASIVAAKSVTVPLGPSAARTSESCPLVPPGLVGRMDIVTNPPSLKELGKRFSDLRPGGRHKPKNCTARHRVAIIIPYRDRAEHLRVFLNHMHHMLRRQQLDYRIVVVEQAGNSSFNRGKLLNVGFVEASKRGYECFIFHDVDMIPENDHNLYTCSEHPRHMTVAISTFNYRLPYQDFFGGACALTKRHMELVNGFSNEYWGWGGEDDDLFYRVNDHHLKVERYPANIARYTTLSHKPAERSPLRTKMLESATSRYNTDGLNSLTYKRLDIVLKKLYTWVLVDLTSTARQNQDGLVRSGRWKEARLGPGWGEAGAGLNREGTSTDRRRGERGDERRHTAVAW